jgi:hypothetical protein
MKTQLQTPMQGALGYREVLQKHNGFMQANPTKKAIRNLIALARRCGEVVSLERRQRDELVGIAATWEKFL